MLSAEQLIVVAYYSERTGVLCRHCGEADPEMKMGEALSAYEAGEFAGSEGLTCEECSKEIIEAYQWTCPACDETYYGEEAESKESDYTDEEGCGGRLCTGLESEEEDEDESE